jgi:hypothetical protein
MHFYPNMALQKGTKFLNQSAQMRNFPGPCLVLSTWNNENFWQVQRNLLLKFL